MKFAIAQQLTADDAHLLGSRILLVGGGTWTGAWFGRGRVLRSSERVDGVAFMVGHDADALCREVMDAPDPVVIVLYSGRRSEKARRLEQAVASKRAGGTDARLVAMPVLFVQGEVLPGGPVIAWTEVRSEAAVEKHVVEKHVVEEPIAKEQAHGEES